MYQRGKIYKLISCSTKKIYIGSTTMTLRKRLASHKSSYESYKKGQGIRFVSSFILMAKKDCSIVLIENFPCSSKKELLAREEKHRRRNLKNCVNLRSCYGVDKQKEKLRYMKWVENNKEHLRDYSKRYREANRDRIARVHRAYDEKNKDRRKQYKHEYHLQNKDHLREINKKYRESHKDEISKKKMMKNKCECGSKVSNCHMARHRQTKKHLDRMNENK